MNPKNLLRYTILSTALILSGCGTTSDPTRFYSLQSNSFEPEIAQYSNNFEIAIASVRIPRLIDRPQIVSRLGSFEVKRSEFHQWAGSIQEEIERTISERLKKDLLTDKVHIYPNQIRPRPALELHINILRFDGELGNQTWLKLNWQLSDKNTRGSSVFGSTELSLPLADNSYSTYVAGLHTVLDKATIEIAAELSSQYLKK